MDRHTCYGGNTGRCNARPVWGVKTPDTTTFTYVCGRHLHFAADEASDGEQVALDLVRIRTDEH